VGYKLQLPHGLGKTTLEETECVCVCVCVSACEGHNNKPSLFVRATNYRSIISSHITRCCWTPMIF